MIVFLLIVAFLIAAGDALRRWEDEGPQTASLLVAVLTFMAGSMAEFEANRHQAEINNHTVQIETTQQQLADQRARADGLQSQLTSTSAEYQAEIKDLTASSQQAFDQMSHQLADAKAVVATVVASQYRTGTDLQRTKAELAALLPRRLSDRARADIASVIQDHPMAACVIHSEPGVEDAAQLAQAISEAIVSAGGSRCQWDGQFHASAPFDRIVVYAPDPQAAYQIAAVLATVEPDTRYYNVGSNDDYEFYLGARK